MLGCTGVRLLTPGNACDVTTAPAVLAEAPGQQAAEMAELSNLPISLLPTTAHAEAKPFGVGIGTELRARLKPEIFGKLNDAVRGYGWSLSYQLAAAQPGARCHDIDANLVEAVKEFGL